MDELLYERRDGIGFVTLNRPQARNALTFPMYERLREIALGAAAEGEAVHRGDGRLVAALDAVEGAVERLA